MTRVDDVLLPPLEAVTSDWRSVGTARVVMAKDAVRPPAAIVMAAGKLRLVEFEVIATTDPPIGAGPERVIVPVAGEPPVTVAGAKVKFIGLGGTTDRFVETDIPPRTAEIFAPCAIFVGKVVIGKDTEDAPTGIITVAGTLAKFELEFNKMSRPPDGAIPVVVTRAVTVFPPATST
jgi:hypothetical protein